jgi:hypothetical protein
VADAGCHGGDVATAGCHGLAVGDDVAT